MINDDLEKALESFYNECLNLYVLRQRSRYTQKAKRRIIETIIRANPTFSDRMIAHKTGFSREFVSKTRGEKNIRAPYIVGLDGKTYKNDKRSNQGRSGSQGGPGIV